MRRAWVSIALLMGVLIGGFGRVVSVMAVGDVCSDSAISEDLKEVAGCNNQDKTAMPAVVYLIDVALSLVGIIAVAMVIYGAVIYVISTGDATKLNRAKNAIIYGIVGLVVALLAFAIVTFVSQSL